MTLTLIPEEDKRPQSLNFSPEKIKLIKDTVCKGSTDAELEVFLHICKHMQLDPFLKQIFSIPRGGQRTVQVSIDGFRLIAERTGKYAPGKESTFIYDEKGAIISATSWIRKMTPDGTWHDIGATAYMSEFKGSTTFWTKMPHVMLSKVAEAVALRKAFPADLSGIYSEDEMAQADVEVTDPIRELKKLEESLLLGTEDDVKQLYIAFFEKYKTHFHKLDKKKWMEPYIDKLSEYVISPGKFMKAIQEYKEKQLALNAPQA